MKGYTRCSDGPGTQSEGQGILPVEVMPSPVEAMPNLPLEGRGGTSDSRGSTRHSHRGLCTP